MGNPKRFAIKASRWPWQPGYNWHGMTNSTAPLNQPLPGELAAPRFGAGWKYKLGLAHSGSKSGFTLMIDLIWGMVTITYRSRYGIERDRRLEEQRAQWRREREERERQHVQRMAEARERDRQRAEQEAARRASLTPEQLAAEDELPF
jgi:hypothetical protein